MQYFNPRSREGSDKGYAIIANLVAISIHAPARGATPLMVKIMPSSFISIHAPARGATENAAADAKITGFQSTLPRGERLLASGSLFRPADFNPRSREGSDRRISRISSQNLNFNPRSREGRDTPIAGSRTFPFEFQSTLPRGERRSGLSVYKQ